MRFEGQFMCIESLEAFSKLFGCIVLVHYNENFHVVQANRSFESLLGLPRVHLQCLQATRYSL